MAPFVAHECSQKSFSKSFFNERQQTQFSLFWGFASLWVCFHQLLSPLIKVAYRWQGSYSKPAFPFGTDMSKLDPTIQPTIDGLVGDCLGGPNCDVKFSATNGDGVTTGFLARMEKYFAKNPNATFEWIIILGGANDVIAACLDKEWKWLNNIPDQLPKLATLALTRSSHVLLLPTFQSPIFAPNANCFSQYDNFLGTFQSIASSLVASQPGRVFTANTTAIIPEFSNSLFIDTVHLTEYGNMQLAKGILPITKHDPPGSVIVGSNPSSNTSTTSLAAVKNSSNRPFRSAVIFFLVLNWIML